ncbi:hypothetical protein, variant [Verruconis gallopava]|uniref:Photolyase/cryptochrome alpha/beta domain-containing protein n=1 Tax=Verruconis gallopava TaxID=253628 RepID=A0A0D2A324_9PEZI|nr:hypothetical protein, variant [Verruconis gallopava]KIW01183.1 hypothetical protein, variant [Verruconis gallopava]
MLIVIPVHTATKILCTSDLRRARGPLYQCSCLAKAFHIVNSSCLRSVKMTPKLKKQKLGSGRRVIYWFRTDLRLHDSPALKTALDLDPEAFYPIWCWDPHYMYRARVGPNRFQFLIDCQNDLSNSITKLNKKSKLFVMREAPQTLLPKLWREWDITHLVFEKDTDAYARQRDDKVKSMAKDAGVEVLCIAGRTLWDSDELVAANSGNPTMSLSQVQKAGAKVGEINRPIPPPKKIPDPGNLSLSFEHEKPSKPYDVNSIYRDRNELTYSSIAGPENDFAVPTIDELGLKKPTTSHRGGETIALEMLEAILANHEYTATFEKPKTAPTEFEPQSTTLLSPHLHFGSLSCRRFYWGVQDTVARYKGRASTPPTSLTGQLLFRDMYFGAQAKIGTVFGQTFNNPGAIFSALEVRTHWFSLDRCTDATASPRRVDPSLGKTCCCLLSNTWRVLCGLGAWC